MICGACSLNGTMELQVWQGLQTVAGYVEMLQQASLLTEGTRLCDDGLVFPVETTFQQDNTAVHNTQSH